MVRRATSTEHQRTADEAEIDYRLVVENSRTGVVIIQDSRIVYVNPRLCHQMGYVREDVLGTSIWDYIHPDDIPELADAQRRRLAGEDVPAERVARAVTKSGEVRYFDFRANLIDYKGAPAILLNAIDITERVRAEEALAKSESEFRDLVEKTSDWLWQVDEDFIYTYSSPRSRDLLGYEPDEIVGKSPFDLMTPDEAKRVRELLATVIAKRDPIKLFENTMVAKDGRLVVVETSGEPTYDDQGRFRGYRGIDRDITERRRAEAELRESREMLQLVMDNIPQAVFWKDLDSVYLGCNKVFASTVGLEDPRQIVGKTDFDLPWGEDLAKWYRRWDRRVMSSDKPAYHIEETAKTADGKTIIVDTTKVPLHDPEGRVVGVLGTYEDVTERRRAEQALQEAEAQYRNLVEETMVGVYVIQDDQYVYANPRMLEILGAESADVLGKSPLEFTAPQDRAMVAENIRKRIHGEARSMTYGYKALRKDGTLVDVEAHDAFTTFRGRPAIIGSLLDDTERKRYLEALQDSEERYRQLFEHSPDMLFLISAQTGTFIAMNPAVTQQLGYAPYDVLGKSPWDISPEFQPDGRSSKQAAQNLMASQIGAPARRFDWVHKRKDGSLADCEVSLIGYRFHGEDLIQAIVRDVTDRKRAEEQRRQLERDLEEQKRSFYRETILSVTDGTLDVCDRQDVEPYLTNAQESVEVNEVADAGAARRKVEEFCREHGLQEDRLRDFIIAAGEAITNAIKHGTRGKVYVGDNEESVWVVVSDEGPGIESLILPRAVLLRGFSTKPSLGLGYSIMLEVCDRILLCTDKTGTTVVLVKDKRQRELDINEYLPDTWDSIPS